MDLLVKALDLTPDRFNLDENGDFDCLQDDEDKLRDKRFQNENLYNRLLPYDVSAESQEHLMRIKTSLARCVQLDQATVYEWIINLERFVDLYGLAFTKEEHIYFVKLQYELLVADSSMDLDYIACVARCYSRLMRKRYLISSDELQLDWRPLYDTYVRLLFSESESIGLRFVPENLESNLSQAIRLSRPHFPIEATQEMLDEWRPMLCPSSVSIQRAFTCMNLFLPTTLPPEHHDKGFKLWFSEVMQLWLSGKVCLATYESKFTLLLSRLSSDCMGYVDWDPYIPRIFNHFKTSLNLSGGLSKSTIRRHNEAIDVGPCVQWMIYMINRENSCLDHISTLFKAIKSFYHPSNLDRRWHAKLQQFLYKLPAYYVNRLYRERFKKNIWSRRIPESHKLTEEQTTKFVDALMPVVLTSMFNPSGISSAALAFRDLSVLRPERVIPPLLERLYGSYETLTEPHRLLSSINCMASVIPAMVRKCKFFPEGPTHVVPLLLNSLPGIDSNDMRKCIAVFRFIASIAAHIQMKDYSYLVDERGDLTIEQQQLCLSSSRFEDFVIQFLDKCFILIDNTASAIISSLDQDSHSKNGEEGIVEAAISSVTLSILAQASHKIQSAALDKLHYYVTSHIFDTKTQGKAIATLCLACAKSKPKETLQKFVPHFGKLILALTENEEVFKESILDEELLFSLLLISEIVRCNSPHILDHKELIVQVLKRAFSLNSREGYLLGCSILRHLLRALTNITCCDWRNIDYDDETCRIVEERWPFDNWAHTTHVKDLKLRWEIPGPESREFALELLQIFMKQSVDRLLEWSKDKCQLSREVVQRSLYIILSSLVGAASVLPALKSKVINLCPFEVPVISLCIRNTGTEPLDFPDGTNIRTWVLESMKQILAHIQMTNEDNTKILTLICEIFAASIAYFGYNKTELRLAAQRIKSMKSGAQNKLLGSKRYLRYLLVERVAQQHRAMLMNKGDPDFTELHLDIFKCLFELSQSHYVEVRILAQDTVYMMLNCFPLSENVLVPMLVKELRQTEIEHKKFKGLLYLVIGRRSYSSIAVDPNWSLLRELWPSIVESPHSESPSIVKLLDRICGLIQKSFDTFGLRNDFSEKVKEIASHVWTGENFDLEKYPAPDPEYIGKVREQVQKRNEQRIEDYEQLIIKLVKLIEDPLLHWHRRIIAFNLFTHLMRDDHPLPLAALNLCLTSLVSERLSIRLKAIQLVSAQLKLHKRRHAIRKIRVAKIDSLGQSGGHAPESSTFISVAQLETEAEKISLNEKEVKQTETPEEDKLGLNDFKIICNSNKWMQYKLSEMNFSKEEWDRLILIDKPHIGFYEWPREIKVYEPYHKQPKLDRDLNELNEYESLVFKTFNDQQFVEKLVNYFCFEDNKGSPDFHQFDIKRPALFKGLFRNFGPSMIEPFRSYIVEYSQSSCEQKQRLVIEFLAGLLRGSKHWSWEMLDELRKFVIPFLDRMTFSQENFNDWTGLSNYVFRHRDARRLGWLLNYFVMKAISPSESQLPTVTPFIQQSRLTLAHYSLIQCEWRSVDHIFPLVIAHLMRQDHLLAYANVRTCLASIYSLIYMFDDPTTLSRIPGTLDNRPKRSEFIDYLLSKLVILEKTRKTSAGITNSPDDLDTSLKATDPPLELTQPQFDGGNNEVNLMAECHKNNLLDKLRSVGTESAASINSIAIDPETTHEQILSLLKCRQPIANPGSSSMTPSTSYSSNDHKLLIDQVATNTETTPDVALALVDKLRRALPNLSRDLSGESQEQKEAIKLMKLTSRWIIYNVCRLKSPVSADFFKLLPVVCEMGRDMSDPDLAADSLAAVAILASSTLSSEAVVESLFYIRKIISEHSWHARVAVAAFLEMMVSANLFKLLSCEEWRKEVEEIVIDHLICDERIEVRESSSLTLSGMIHCEFTKLTPELVNKFKKRATQAIIRRKQPNGLTIVDQKSTVMRHSGILCLCACVDAHPYSVPDYLPDILTLLSDHLTDPQPISTTIKKTMSNFRRTHYDNWQSDKTKFTDDQLCILADLLVSPSYYA